MAEQASIKETGNSEPEELALRVLRFLSGQALPPTPANYELAYIVLSKPAGVAARAVDSVLMNGDRLTQADVDRLLVAAREKPKASHEEDENHAQVRRGALQLAEAASKALADTGAFGRSLADDHGAIGETDAKLGALVAAMIERSARTEEQLSVAAKTIEALRQEIEVARGDAERDSLTGLLNRRGIMAAAKKLNQGAPVSVSICDIDRFKSVNDRYGHVVGDRVLKLVAASLVESCAPHPVGRWGGEEFVVIMPGVDPHSAVAILDQALDDLAKRNVKLRTTDEPLGRISFSAGVAALGGQPLDAAISTADALLYQAKEAGRCRVFGPDQAGTSG